MGSFQPLSSWGYSRKPTTIAILGLLVAGSKLLLLPLLHILPTTLLSILSDFALTLLLSVAAWQASRRSSALARVVWLSVAVASALWTVSAGIHALGIASSGLGAALAVFWRSTIIFYLVGIAFTVPLLLREDPVKAEIDWLRTFDIAQLGIVTFCAYLLFFYIPMVTSPSEAFRVRHFMILHWLRDGFLALGFLYRGCRSSSRTLRRLQFGLSIFFVVYSVTASFGFYFYVKALPWQIPFLAFLIDGPAIFLLLMAATWRQQVEVALRSQIPSSSRELFWAQLLPVVLPVSVIAIASRISTQYLRVAWITVAASVVCYAGRLMVMQRRQDVAQSRLRALEEKFSKAFKLSPAAITISRLSDDTYIDVNDRWLELTQLAREEVIGRTSIELGIWENPEDRKELEDAIRKKGSARDLTFNFHMAGRTVAVLLSAELIELEGQPLIIASVLDVTELTNATQQLRQAQKMELIGSLAGGIAHDFNNLLTVIMGYAGLAQTHGLEGEVAQQVGEIREAASRAAALTQHLLAFSRRQVLQPRNIVMNTVVSGIEPMLRRMIREDIELVFSLASDLGTVYADSAQIEQVLMNLAANARDAMPNGGQLRFETRNLELPSSYVERNLEIPPGRYVMLAVSDTGTGIAPEHLGRIFEPFFTTKEVGRGTGLGLSTVYGIIRQSGGYVWPYSEVGVGTTFKVCLPRVDKAEEVYTLASTGPEVLGGAETVLLVEDDGNVRELAARILGHYGYQVVAAASAEEGLRCSNEYAGEIQLLLTDMVMAKGSGKELAERLKTQRPSLKVIYISGYPQSVSSANPKDLREAFLAKPFAPSELARKVRGTLDRT